METTIEVHEQSQVAEVRRVVAHLAGLRGLSHAEAGRAALVATELSTNLVKYGKRGEVAVGVFDEWGVQGVQIVATDRGPGFANFMASSRDGHSTGGSLGIGLGSIMRAADLFDIYTLPGQGSAVLVRVAKGKAKPEVPPAALWTGARAAPKPGQAESGDAWACLRKGRWQRLCLVDGLGHGPLAATAARDALAVFRAATERDSPLDILARTHEAIKSTRGAVMAVVAIDSEAGTLQFCGVGNIAGVLHTGEQPAQHLLSVEGVVGYNARKLKMQEGAWTADSAVVLNTDGLSTRLSLSRYPGLLQRHPSLAASVLYRDFARHTDDATVLVAKGVP